MSLAVGIACYPTFGGSGIVATEIGRSLARRGHRVHFLCSAIPGRLDPARDGVAFHAVTAPPYPLFDASPYTLALCSKMVQVAERERLDLLHVHYAVPHAASAYLARQILGARAPKVVTTLHGTDITLVGSDESFLPITRFSILQSDALTAPSEYLCRATHEKLAIPTGSVIDVIPNFVDTDWFRPVERARGGPPLVVHGSNFRPLKRVPDVVRVFARVRRALPEARLLLVGDGPERPRVALEVRALGLEDAVEFAGERADVVPLLQRADLFLLPSETESFGLAALEAMACGVPVIASRVGGVPEVVEDGAGGLLFPVGDVEAMAEGALALLGDRARCSKMGQLARARAVERFAREPIVDRYEALYRRLL